MKCCLFCTCVVLSSVPQLESEPEVKQIGEAPEDVPFAIPEKWKWSQLLGIFDVYQPKTISTKELNADGNYFVYGANGVIGKYTNYNHENSEVVIACRGATCGAVNITRPKSWINGNAMVVRPINNLVCHEYLVAFLKVFNWDQVTSGSAQPQITRKNLSSVLFPVPPIKEQHRIVTKLNQLFEQIDRAEKAYNELSGPLSDRFRQLCLEKAIQGKLVPQLESEPPVEQIGKLIDKIPFFIPYKWKWIQLKHATTKITDGTHHSPPSSSKGDFLYITAKNIKSSGVDLVNVTYVSKDIHEEIFKRCNPEPGDVLFIKDGATTGVVTINNLEKPFSLLSSVALLKVKREILLPEFLVHVLRSQYTRELIARQMQGTGIPRVTLKKLKELWIPIPPLNEQYRISKKLLNVFAAMPCEN